MTENTVAAVTPRGMTMKYKTGYVHCPCCIVRVSIGEVEWESGNFAMGKYACNACWGERVDALHNRPQPPLRPNLDVRFCVELHIGFLGIIETPEQLARLRNESATEKPAKPARSRISKTHHIIRPIDKVASIVVNTGATEEGSPQ